MADSRETRINARGLSAPGPRMMVETALSERPASVVRVIVSKEEAIADVESCLREKGARVVVDAVGEEYHILGIFGSNSPDE